MLMKTLPMVSKMMITMVTMIMMMMVIILIDNGNDTMNNKTNNFAL